MLWPKEFWNYFSNQLSDYEDNAETRFIPGVAFGCAITGVVLYAVKVKEPLQILIATTTTAAIIWAMDYFDLFPRFRQAQNQVTKRTEPQPDLPTSDLDHPQPPSPKC